MENTTLIGNIFHLEQLKKGRDSWNTWKDTNVIRPDLKGFNLDNLDLSGFHLDQSDFTDASMRGCNLNQAWLTWCVFIRTDLSGSTIINPEREEHSGDKRLLGVNLRWSAFAEANLSNVDMRGAVLEAVSFFDCNFNGADISTSEVNGVSAWGNHYDSQTKQNDLIVSAYDEENITIDHLDLAQFIYLLLNSNGLRSAINSLTTKVVLILGSFAPNDMEELEGIKKELRLLDFIPMLYNFEKPSLRNHMETVSTIAHLSNFIVAELTNPKSIPNELRSLIPNLISVPVIPLIRDKQKPFGMFEDFKGYRNVGEIIEYNSNDPKKNIVLDVIRQARQISELIQKS